MTNKFPTLSSIFEHKNPIYTIQLLTVLANDGGKFYVLYIQDMITFKVVQFKVFEYPVKFIHALEEVADFIKTLENVKNVTLVFLKTSPFSNKHFYDVLNLLGINTSYYKRSERLELYYTHKLRLKGLIRYYPDNIEKVIKLWNSFDNEIYLSAKLDPKIQLKSKQTKDSKKNEDNKTG